MSKLHTTTDFLTLYLHAQGETEAPRVWHLWSGISLLAAAAQNRIYLMSPDGRMLYPNLYIMLIGGSGEGKGTSCEKTAIGQYVSPTVNYPYVYDKMHVLAGRYTMPAIYDYAKTCFPSEQRGNMVLVENAAFWLVQEELANGVGRDKGRVNAFIEGMTELYDKVGSEGGDATRTHGAVRFRNPCINWLTATTEAWYLEVIGSKDLLSGFGARIIQVFGRKDYDNPIPYDVLPPDVEIVKKYLRDRIAELVLSCGPIRYTPEAQEVYADWYRSRPKPDDESEKPVWNRIPVFSLKVAMITCLSRNEKVVSGGGETNWFLTPEDILEGVRLVENVWATCLEKVQRHAASTPQSRVVSIVGKIIERYTQKSGGVSHNVLMRRANDYHGINAEAVRPVLAQLISDQGLVAVEKRGHRLQDTFYKWKDAL